MSIIVRVCVCVRVRKCGLFQSGAFAAVIKESRKALSLAFEVTWAPASKLCPVPLLEKATREFQAATLGHCDDGNCRDLSL